MKDSQQRLLSIDAFRGFDMFWISGGGVLVLAIARLFPGGDASFVVRQLQHVDWAGLHFEDLIFPVFLFIAGLSFPFSFAKQVARGDSVLSRHLKVLRRVLVLMVLGMFYNGFFGCDWHHLAEFRYSSVLGKIGLAWGVAALFYMHLSRRGRLVACLAGLVGYAALLCVTAPDAPAGASSTSLQGCFVGWLDRHFTPGHLYCDNLMEPSGPFVSFFGYPTAMIGMFAGDLLRSDRFAPARKSLLLLLGGAVLLGVGYALSPVCPIVKKLWTPSFALVACGWGLLVFSFFHYAIDVLGWTRWTYFFRVIGANAIVAYLANRSVEFDPTVRLLLGGPSSLLPAAFSGVIFLAGRLALLWLILDFLYRRKVFFKV